MEGSRHPLVCEGSKGGAEASDLRESGGAIPICRVPLKTEQRTRPAHTPPLPPCTRRRGSANGVCICARFNGFPNLEEVLLLLTSNLKSEQKKQRSPCPCA